MFSSFSSMFRAFIAILFISSLYIACGGGGDECQNNNDCIKAKGEGWACVVKSGKKVCEKKSTTGCKADSDCDAGKKCNTTTGECEAVTTGCKSNNDCAATETCNVATGKCEPKSTGCKSNSDCAATETCNVATGKCEPKSTGCKSNNDCAATETCNVATGKCEPKSTGCKSNADCPSGQTCNVATGKCETTSTGCKSNADCTSGQTCNVATGKCETTSTGCKSDADCTGGQKCNVATGKCEGGGGTAGVGQVCDPQNNPCQAGLFCIGIQDLNKSLCFQDCTQNQNICASNTDGRTSCIAFARTQAGETISVCLGEAAKGGKCGFEGAGQSICKRDQNPPLYCSNTGTCDEAIVQKNEGDPCNKEDDNTEPIKICDSSIGLVCGPQGTCIKADQANEGEPCDPDGKTLGKQVLCKTGMICVGFSFGDITVSHCHAECDTSKSNCTGGMSCLALSGGGTRGVCLTTNCNTDADCPFKDYQCAQTTGGQKICFPPQPAGPNEFGQLCGTPVNTKGCKKGLLCLRADEKSVNGFCSQGCTQSGTCPGYTNSQGQAITAQCVAINQEGDKVCLFPCGQPGQTCPDGLNCVSLTGGEQICLAP